MYSRRFRSLVQNLFAGKKPAKPAFFEPLEDRRLRSASLNTSTSVWTLNVNGTSADDAISVSLVQMFGNPLSEVKVIENGVQTYRSPIRVDKIDVRGGSGNDTISISSSITAPAYVYGDIGNDTITGGGGNDTLDGWAGAD